MNWVSPLSIPSLGRERKYREKQRDQGDLAMIRKRDRASLSESCIILIFQVSKSHTTGLRRRDKGCKVERLECRFKPSSIYNFFPPTSFAKYAICLVRNLFFSY